MDDAPKVQWLRALVGGVVAEVGILLVAIPLSFLPSGERALLWAIPPTCLVMTFMAGQWTARRVGSRFVLHGTLVGVVAAAIYIAVTWSQTLPLSYIVSHGLKVVGGAAGGLAAARSGASAFTKSRLV